MLSCDLMVEYKENSQKLSKYSSYNRTVLMGIQCIFNSFWFTLRCANATLSFVEDALTITILIIVSNYFFLGVLSFTASFFYG